ncbi:cysteine hydrolase family protein [Aminobacter sp. MDW-2]|jgi:nicotinamidase-related amidase|uniref:cysteine hydrolase family protein n=1 Tax=Aminobacter sp. MDW-2 TaxID=2666139 RepID=UPI0012AF9A93|nr:cysteine hydrolase family protein [Aminobacter sp. MDW-2]MRX36019.1 isochorismatase family protein [Aminobacter sp. MDW-2]QNH35764.1 cysteine hydrolase [Aminobacter sp. MDW-2]
MGTALLVIDVQNAILRGKGTSERQPLLEAALDDTIGRLRDLQDRARSAGVPVIVIQHDGPAGHRLAVGTEGWEVRPELAPRAGDLLVRKKSSDSFHETELGARLGELGISHLVVGGCMTQFCVDTTVRRAVSLGYDVTLVADCHTTADSAHLTHVDIIAHHNETLDGFGAGDAVVDVRPAVAISF